MSRISRLDRNQVSPEIAAGFDKVFSQRGNVPNMFRVMAHRPEIFATMQAHFAAVLNTGTVSTKLKELIIVRTSQVTQTPYCLASHTVLARGLGWSDDQLAHLASWPERDDFAPAEKAALRLAETVTRDAHAVTDEQFAELRTHYSEGEIVDSVTGVQVAAGIDSETGSRLSFSGLSKWGDAEAVMTDWAQKSTKRIQEAHTAPAQ